MPWASSRAPSSSSCPQPDEVARDRGDVEARGGQRGAHPLSLGDLGGDVVARIAERGRGDPCRGSGDGGGRPARLEHRRGRGRGDREPDPQGRVAEGLRHRAQDDQVGALVEPRDDRLAAVLDVGLVDDDRRLGVAPGELDELRRRGDDARRVAGIAAPEQARALGLDGRIGPGQERRDAVERVGRRDDRRRPARREEGAGAEQDEVVGARPDHHLLPAHLAAGIAADVRRRGFAQVPIRPRGVLVQRGEALRQRHLGDTRQRRHVLVELQHLHGVEAVARCHLRHRCGPRVGRVRVRERDRARPAVAPALTTTRDACSVRVPRPQRGAAALRPGRSARRHSPLRQPLRRSPSRPGAAS